MLLGFLENFFACLHALLTMVQAKIAMNQGHMKNSI